MDLAFIIMVALIGVALLFDYLNGMHDAANSIATVVATRVLTPLQAVCWAAFFNFIAFLFFGTAVAQTIGRGIISPEIIDSTVIFGALGGAIFWNLFTWWFGVPSSSSHALIGGLLGAGIAKAGTDVVVLTGVLKTVAGIFVAPLLGFTLAMLLMLLASWLFVRARPQHADKFFRGSQLISSALYSLGHGGNDAQKTMGIIAALLVAYGYNSGPDAQFVPLWVVLVCHAAMGLGTLSGGWRIVKTMGQRVTELRPVQGFAAETGGAICLFYATHIGVPVSTTHTISGCIMGVGAARRPSAVRWGVARAIVFAWVVTIPACAVVAGLVYWITRLLTGQV